MSKFTYTVDPETLEVFAYAEGQELPFIYQPDQPDMTSWDSVEQATEWIEGVIYNLENPPAPVEEVPAE